MVIDMDRSKKDSGAIPRSVQRGSRLLPQCNDPQHRPIITTHEYGEDDMRVYCYGLEDASPGILNDECRECGALVWNARPPK